MYRVILIFLSIALFNSCYRPCPSDVGNLISVSWENDTLADSTVISKYNRILHVERNHTFDTLFSYTPTVDEYYIYKFGDLPIDLEADTATYILQGDSVIDTLIISYNISMVYINNRCRYYAQVNDFKINYATFQFIFVSYSYGRGGDNVFEIKIKE